MLVRSAFWIGQPHAGQESALRHAIDEAIIPAMRKFPGVSAVRALWPEATEDDPPRIWCQVIVEYASADDRARMMACPQRAELRPHIVAAKAMFDGTLSHIDYAAR